MLYNLIASSGEAGHRILVWIEYAALVIEILAVVIIVGAIFSAKGHYLIRSAIRPEDDEQYRLFKVRLGKALLLGLEILVAEDPKTVGGSDFHLCHQKVAQISLLVHNETERNTSKEECVT